MVPAGVILAGGQSRRMGGGDKALLPLAGKPVLQHVITRLMPQVGPLILSANGDPARFAAFSLPVVPDRDETFAGPLAGLLAAMAHAEARWPAVKTLVSVPADTPFIPADLVARLTKRRREDDLEIVMAASGGRAHPTVALWSLGLWQPLAQALESGEKRVRNFIESRRYAAVDWPMTPADPFANINTPEDLAEAEQITSRE